jgi:hypothetical protein
MKLLKALLNGSFVDPKIILNLLRILRLESDFNGHIHVRRLSARRGSPSLWNSVTFLARNIFVKIPSEYVASGTCTCGKSKTHFLNALQGTCEELTQPGTSVSNSHLHGRLASEIMSIISDEHILTGDLSLYSSVHLCQQVQRLLKQIEQSAIDAWQPRSFKASKSMLILAEYAMSPLHSR